MSDLRARLECIERQQRHAELRALAEHIAAESGQAIGTVLADFALIDRAEVQARDRLGIPPGVYNRGLIEATAAACGITDPEIWQRFLETVCRHGDPNASAGLSAGEAAELEATRQRVPPQPLPERMRGVA